VTNPLLGIPLQTFMTSTGPSSLSTDHALRTASSRCGETTNSGASVASSISLYSLAARLISLTFVTEDQGL
jgi:hypothetical protein